MLEPCNSTQQEPKRWSVRVSVPSRSIPIYSCKGNGGELAVAGLLKRLLKLRRRYYTCHTQEGRLYRAYGKQSLRPALP